jgi:hypothetical protein
VLAIASFTLFIALAKTLNTATLAPVFIKFSNPTPNGFKALLAFSILSDTDLISELVFPVTVLNVLTSLTVCPILSLKVLTVLMAC